MKAKTPKDKITLEIHVEESGKSGKPKTELKKKDKKADIELYPPCPECKDKNGLWEHLSLIRCRTCDFETRTTVIYWELNNLKDELENKVYVELQKLRAELKKKNGKSKTNKETE